MNGHVNNFGREIGSINVADLEIDDFIVPNQAYSKRLGSRAMPHADLLYSQRSEE